MSQSECSTIYGKALEMIRQYKAKLNDLEKRKAAVEDELRRWMWVRYYGKTDFERKRRGKESYKD
jgi:hypothetical protein